MAAGDGQTNDVGGQRLRFYRWLGWKLMGYPAVIGYRRLVIDPVPGWETVYGWGARLTNWRPPAARQEDG